MKKKAHVLAMLMASIFATSHARAQTAVQKNPAPAQPQKPESFLHRVLRISGIAASPAALKGPGDEVQSGQIWIVEVTSKKARSLTPNGGYRSPVLSPGGAEILALHGNDVVRVIRSGGDTEKLYSIPGISKLVGFSLDNSEELLVLVTDGTGNTTVGLLSVSTGKVEALPYDRASSQDKQMLEHLRSWDRVYGDRGVYVKRQSKQSIAGAVQWTDVFLKEGESGLVNVSGCDEVNCGQPSLSADGKFLVFVKAEH